MGLQAGLREGSFPGCWGCPRLGHIAAFLHYIITTSLSLPYLCSKKPAKAEYSSVPIFDTAFISEAKLLKEEAVRDDQGLEKCRK